MAGLPDPNSGSRLRRPRWRWLLLGGMLLVVLLIRLGAWQGLLRPVHIAGDSMADTFLGPHYVVHCADCGIDFHCGLDFPPADGEAMCPNCGYADNSVESLPIVAGQRVVIDRWLMPWQRVRTWQAVAFSYPADREFLAIKRVVAGGSGRVAIRHGDVYVDGHIQRKTLDQLHKFASWFMTITFVPRATPVCPVAGAVSRTIPPGSVCQRDTNWTGSRSATNWPSTGCATTSGFAGQMPLLLLRVMRRHRSLITMVTIRAYRAVGSIVSPTCCSSAM